jgi:hypothetical protein
MSRRPAFRRRDTALWVGVGGIVLGSFALYDAYERRGATRPWFLKWLPGA